MNEETLRSWANGEYCDGYPMQDIARLASELLAVRTELKVLMADICLENNLKKKEAA